MVIDAIQILVALGILNVWLVRKAKSTAWRGGDAQTLQEEFEVYGLPPWFMRLIGALKLACAAGLIVGLWVPGVTAPAALALALLMLGAVAMHVKVSDPLKKSLPAFSVLVLCLIVAAG